MLVFSVIAATIASQAIITGSFALVSQAIALEFCVPFNVVHTSRSIISHIYIPAVNYFLLALTLAVTIGFQSSERITNAYGVTVCSVMVLTTILYMMVMRWSWSKPIWLVILFGIFLIIDLYTFAAICTTKISSGGYVAIIIAFSLFIFSFSWYYGNIRLKYYLSENCKTQLMENLPTRLGLKRARRLSNETDDEEDLDDNSFGDDDDNGKHFKYNKQESTRLSFVESLHSSTITEENDVENQVTKNGTVITTGVGCFLTTSRKYTPYVFDNFLRRMHAHQQILIFLKLEYARMPNIDDDQRLLVRVYGGNIYHITALFGYTETNINLFSILHLSRELYGIPITKHQSKITFFLPNETIHVNTKGWKSWLRRWPLYIYSILKSLYPGMPLNFKAVPENTIKIAILADL
jgi:K+ transporter